MVILAIIVLAIIVAIVMHKVSKNRKDKKGEMDSAE